MSYHIDVIGHRISVEKKTEVEENSKYIWRSLASNIIEFPINPNSFINESIKQ